MGDPKPTSKTSIRIFLLSGPAPLSTLGLRSMGVVQSTKTKPRREYGKSPKTPTQAVPRTSEKIPKKYENGPKITIFVSLRRRPRFLSTFCCFCKAKTAYFSHFEAKKGKGKKQKGRPKLVVLFLVGKCTFSPVLSKMLTKT